MSSNTYAGGTATVEAIFTAETAQPGSAWLFVHAESPTSACRLVRDVPLPKPIDGVITARVALEVPRSPACQPQRMNVRLGIYDRTTGQRYAVQGGLSPDDRILAGSFAIIAADQAASTPAPLQLFTPTDLARERWLSATRPWRWWGLGLLLSLVLLGVVRRRGRSVVDPGEEGEGASGAKGWLRWLDRGLFAAVAGTLIFSILVALDFVKDDAYISFRYAHNVVVGEGLVFNAHDRLEGITNFLWTMLMVPFEALHLDLFQVTEVLGSALVLVLLWLMTRIAALLGGAPASPDARGLSWRTLVTFGPALALASSSSVGLWTTSGMEQPLAMVLPMAGAWLLWRSWRTGDQTEATEAELSGARRDASWAGVLVGLGCMTRPDVHLMGVLLALPLLVRAVRQRRLDPVLLRFAAGGLLITVPGHLGRYLYYGALMPNTYYVKTGGGWLVWGKGLEALWEMWSFNGVGVLALLAPLAFIHRRFLAEKLVLGLISVGYMAYIVKVGRDEMHWHRLYLPALPALVTLAGLGLGAAVESLTRAASRARRGAALLGELPGVVGWALLLTMVVTNLHFTWVEMHGLNGRGDLSGNYHPDMGKFVTRHSRPGALVAFQDMGSTPYHAPDLDFFDFIGLTDRVIARTRNRYGLHAFLETAAQRRQGEFDAEMRRYFYKQNPEWVILTSYISGAANMRRVASAFAKRPEPESLGPALGSNRYQLGLYGAKFRSRYVHVRTWPRSASYYLSLFYRRDLWRKTPGEVVYPSAAELPAGRIHGPKAEFVEGVQLLGADVPAEAVAKQEFYLTLWLQVSKPLAKDWWVFVHLERTDADGRLQRTPTEHAPGDFMWTADRWVAGQVIEDRSLVQLPPFMAPGTYDVWVGLYRRSTGQRLHVTRAATADAHDRVKVGRVTIRAQRPFLDQLIRPTDLAVDRAHPERIPDHGRAPTAYAERAQLKE